MQAVASHNGSPSQPVLGTTHPPAHSLKAPCLLSLETACGFLHPVLGGVGGRQEFEGKAASDVVEGARKHRKPVLQADTFIVNRTCVGEWGAGCAPRGATENGGLGAVNEMGLCIENSPGYHRGLRGERQGSGGPQEEGEPARSWVVPPPGSSAADQ